MGLVTDLIEKNDGDVYAAAAEMIHRLMADGPNFKAGYTAGNAWWATLEAFEHADHKLNLLLLVDKAFTPVRPVVYVSVEGGIANAGQTKPYPADPYNDVQVVQIDWDVFDTLPEVWELEGVVDSALELKGTHDEDAISQAAEEIGKFIEAYEGADYDAATVQLDRLRLAMNKEATSVA